MNLLTLTGPATAICSAGRKRRAGGGGLNWINRENLIDNPAKPNRAAYSFQQSKRSLYVKKETQLH